MEKKAKTNKAKKSNKANKTKKAKINYEKLFNFGSLIFIIICMLWYGGRLVYFYLDSKKEVKNETVTLSMALKSNPDNKEFIKNINDDFYFYGDADNNYINYSNILWRVVKINKNNTITLVTDNNIATLAYGDPEDNYEESNLINWLNINKEKTHSGILENTLNNKEKYLTKTETCIDTINDTKNIKCKSKSNKHYLNLLSVEDYLNTGSSKSFINNKKNTYLANKTKDNDIWYLTNDGKVDTTDGQDILGIKATITLKDKINVTSGTGTKEEPYQFEDNISPIGSYVKLDEDIWRIYEEKDGIVKLMLNDTLKKDNENIQEKYSNNTYYHNDTTKGSLAHYLNNTYYNSLSYKDKILENTYNNGYYGTTNNYNYEELFNNTITTKVSIPSIEDIIFSDIKDDYFTNTGRDKNSKSIYIRNNAGNISYKNVTAENNIVPCISIEKVNLKAGSGTIKDPYRMEQ